MTRQQEVDVALLRDELKQVKDILENYVAKLPGDTKKQYEFEVDTNVTLRDIQKQLYRLEHLIEANKKDIDKIENLSMWFEQNHEALEAVISRSKTAGGVTLDDWKIIGAALVGLAGGHVPIPGLN